jgi:hypothetical protein
LYFWPYGKNYEFVLLAIRQKYDEVSMQNILFVILYLLFYGGIAVTLFLFCFAAFGTVKLIKKGGKYKISKKLFTVFTVGAGIISITVIGAFSALVIRFYSLPIATVDNYRENIVLNGETYTLTRKEYPFDTVLKPIARENISSKVFTPEWAIELILRTSYYYFDGENADFIYYAGMMEWLTYEKTSAY